MSVENSGRGTRSGWDIKEWTRYLDENVGTTKRDKNIILSGDMDSAEMLERNEVLRFFRDSKLDPVKKLEVTLAMEELPFNQKSILYAVFWKGMPKEKVTKSLGIALASFKILKSRGLKRMRKILASKEFQKMFESKKNQMRLSLGIKRDSIRPYQKAQESEKKE